LIFVFIIFRKSYKLIGRGLKVMQSSSGKSSVVMERTLTGLFTCLTTGAILMASSLYFTKPSPAQAQPAPLNGSIQSVNGPENVMILLDSSYSMIEPLGGGRNINKMAAAKSSVLEMIRDLPPTANIGLRIYGNSNNQMHACHATTRLVPLGQGNRNMMAAQMIGIQPTGSTPISYSIIQSLNDDFTGYPGKKSIILISDGIETCGEDPCTLAVRMQQLGANVKINVIGLGIDDIAAVKQLRCVALATKGKFFTANTAAELGRSLHNAMAVETHVQATILPGGGVPRGNVEPGNNPPVAVPRNPDSKSSASKKLPESDWLDAGPSISPKPKK
jgi:Ca-activated chloride channel family protein